MSYNDYAGGFMPGITHPYSRQAIVNVSAKFDMTEINTRLNTSENDNSFFPLYKNAPLQDPNVYYNVDMYTPAFRRRDADQIRYFDTSSLMYFTHFNRITFDDKFIKSYYPTQDLVTAKQTLKKDFENDKTKRKKIIRAFEQEFEFVGVTQAEWRPAQHGLTGMEPLSMDNTGDFDVAMAVRGTTTMVNNSNERIYALRPIMWRLPGYDGEAKEIKQMSDQHTGACQKPVSGINPYKIAPIITEASTESWEDFLEQEAVDIANQIQDGGSGRRIKADAVYHIAGLRELAENMINTITAYCQKGGPVGDLSTEDSAMSKYKELIKVAANIGVELHDSLSHNVIGISLTDTEPGQQGDFLLE